MNVNPLDMSKYYSRKQYNLILYLSYRSILRFAFEIMPDNFLKL
jgi:hypothetical protein